MERVRQQKAAIPAALQSLIDREASEERRRDEGIARQALGYFRRQFREPNGRRRQRVVSADCPVRQNEHKRRRKLFAGILAGLSSEIPIEWFDAAAERISIVPRSERLDAERLVRCGGHFLTAGGLAIAAHRLAEPIVHGLRIEEGFNERPAVADR